ncbi:hypothetical protein DAPPUDRAFT_312044 [Daphnia pulex]|uniref:Cytochrome P450 n=1 Tax=Daphnia pulex TaxID=6669 RepID=E9FYP1_DAPPU|nr:hypothetical protein DAPPUDRAFT_312044 [Daphnia pulex]|eukprot:EFX87733.1 hypothetical protein DAPPUDRAFT_312044 [Daphnia pulex]
MGVQIIPDFVYSLIPNTLVLFSVSACFILVHLMGTLFRRYKYVRRCNKIPGPPAQIPLFGSATEFVLPPEEIMPYAVQLYKKYSKKSAVVLSSNKIIDKGPEYDYIQPWLATGFLTSTETAMGRHVDAQQKSDSDYFKAVYKMTHIIQARQTRPWLQPDWLFRLFPLGSEQKRCLSILHGFTDQVIRERKNEHKLRKTEQQQPVDLPKKDDDEFVSKKSRLAFLDLLIQASQDGKMLSDLDIGEEVDTFMVEEKVNEELTRVFGNSNRPVTMNDLSELKYLECCIKEALRLYPSVPIISRQSLEDTIICRYDLPVGAAVIVSPYLIHCDPTYFPDPESFKPERFFPENIVGRHPYAYVPFSAGPRNCIGQKFAMMEEKIILASVLRRFHVKSLDKPRKTLPS